MSDSYCCVFLILLPLHRAWLLGHLLWACAEARLSGLTFDLSSNPHDLSGGLVLQISFPLHWCVGMFTLWVRGTMCVFSICSSRLFELKFFLWARMFGAVVCTPLLPS